MGGTKAAKKVDDPKSELLDMVLTAGLLVLAGLWCTVVAPHTLPTCGKWAVGVVMAIAVVGPFATAVSVRCGLNEVNAGKAREQWWQLVVHITMSILGYKCWGFVSDTMTMWDPEPRPEIDHSIEQLYIAQAAIWFVTAFRHRFAAPIGADYRLMYTHHVITLFLVVGSYYLGEPETYHVGSRRIGGLILFIHDSSDVVIDLLRLAHYLDLDSKSGLYLSEIFFVTNLGTWAYLRLYCFSTVVVYSAWVESPRHPLRDSINVGLTALVCMHVYWYFLFLKILVKLISSEDAKDAGRTYEGDSDDEDGDTDEDKKKSM